METETVHYLILYYQMNERRLDQDSRLVYDDYTYQQYKPVLL
uniref:Uncharacterized protein n=1 Tax=Amphimedon queenslandica TaxID=400682 RepID=A0A1X7SMC1_AMPQE